MSSVESSREELTGEVRRLQLELAEATETLDAIRRGEVDAVLGPGPQGDQIFTLKGADEPYRILIEEMNESAVTLSADGVILYCNRRFAEVLKTPLDKIVGVSLKSFVALPERLAFAELLAAACAGASTGETTLVTGDGGAVELQLALSCLPAGSAATICLVATDISERKRLDERQANAIHELNDLKAAVDQHAIVAITDSKGKITYVNDKFCAISKYSRSELIGQDHRIINSGYHSKEFIRGIWETIGGGGVWKGEVKNKAKDGTFYWVDTTVVPYVDLEGKTVQYIAIRADITERHEKTIQLQAARAEAERANAAKSQFLANMSHEIRTPMNGIIGMTDLTLDTDLTPEQRDYLGMVKVSAHSLLELINNILDFSKIEAGKLELESVDFSLRDCVGGLLKPLGIRANQKGLELQTEIADNVPDLLIGDPLRLRQILINFTDNAIKFTSRGKIVVTVTHESTLEDECHLRFTVSDTGVGIPETKQGAIFEAFAQADDSTTRTHGGTGLGLAIATQLVEKMRGKISMKSVVGKGTTFHFVAPFKLAQGIPRIAALVEDLSPALRIFPPGLDNQDGTDTTKLRILVAEDNEINRAFIIGTLSNRGHSIVHARNGREALELARAQVFDLIFMDVQMPEMDGLEATRQIRQTEQSNWARRTPIIAMTAYAMSGDRERCLAAGMDRYLSKPLEKNEILEALERVSTGGVAPVQADIKHSCGVQAFPIGIHESMPSPASTP